MGEFNTCPVAKLIKKNGWLNSGDNWPTRQNTRIEDLVLFQYPQSGSLTVDCIDGMEQVRLVIMNGYIAASCNGCSKFEGIHLDSRRVSVNSR